MEGHLCHVYSQVCTLNHLYAGNMTVILVQVNPGETFTIRAEDGSLQCIQGQ
ncbi:Fibronectin type III domain-containing protein 3B [Takifugu flavidus]|uniref:Fibronectin type III domain-containing protein 3B n=1 Tax=Takifugu flavidus TaxID=433684 RepID=A0A5C6P191_9TELE|nr:Fibronectin type III domain-containing protein 3B [Takifugu flavidus]